MLEITAYNAVDFAALDRRMSTQVNADVERAVSEILEAVRTRCDEALLRFVEACSANFKGN